MRASLTALALTLTACATNTARFTETQALAPDGRVLTTTTFETSVQTTAGSKLAEGAGSMDYSADDWRLRVGGAASGLQASGDPVLLLRQIIGALQVVAPLLQPVTPAPMPGME